MKVRTIDFLISDSVTRLFRPCFHSMLSVSLTNLCLRILRDFSTISTWIYFISFITTTIINLLLWENIRTNSHHLYFELHVIAFMTASSNIPITLLSWTVVIFQRISYLFVFHKEFFINISFTNFIATRH